MKKFSFKLQKVKDVKESIEQQKMMGLAEAEREVKIEKEKLQKFVIKKKRYITMFTEQKENGRISASKANQFLKYIDKLSKDIDKQKNMVKESIKNAERKRNDLIEAVKDKKILEKLKENKLVDYKKDINKQEQNFLDEIGAVKAARGEQIKV